MAGPGRDSFFQSFVFLRCYLFPSELRLKHFCRTRRGWKHRCSCGLRCRLKVGETGRVPSLGRVAWAGVLVVGLRMDGGRSREGIGRSSLKDISCTCQNLRPFACVVSRQLCSTTDLVVFPDSYDRIPWSMSGVAQKEGLVISCAPLTAEGRWERKGGEMRCLDMGEL